MPKLKIYKASAGSGKTFQLVREYLLIVFANPDEFPHVLGVTFTNKATGEMKGRILEELNKLSSGKPSEHRQALMEYFKKPEEWVKQRATILFSRVLHQYHEFHIQTIDSFFQRIIRGFARDIGLTAGFNLELDTDNVLNACIKDLINELQEESEHGKWLIRFAEQRIEENKNWDLQHELFNFSREVFREKFTTIANEIIEFVEDKHKIDSLYSTIHRQVNEFEKQMYELGTKGLKVIEEHDLKIEDFSYGKTGFASVFKKVKNKDFDFGTRILGALNNESAWYSNSSSKQIKEKIIEVFPKLNSILCEIINLYNYKAKIYFAAINAKKYLYQLGVLSLILQYIRKYRDEQDVILMPDTAPLIYNIVKHNEEAFIYEKTGTYFHHFLLDEFQDTSELQWENFKPLISNSISQDYVSLLVGDVKQSIYRFRNGDWRLLMYKAQRDIPYSEVISMDTNYRSAEMIVRFNNTIFSLIPSILGNIFKNLFKQAGINSEVPGWFELAYTKQEQRFISNKGKGYVLVKSFVKEEKESNIEDETMAAMIPLINNALSRGFELKDIVVLCRLTKDAAKIYDYLSKYGSTDWKIISEKSLQLKNNGYVRIIVSALKWLANSQNLIARANLITEITKYKLKLSDDELWNYIQNPPELLSDFFNEADSIRQMVIMDALIRIHELFDNAGFFDRNEDLIFYQTLMDEIIEFTRTGDHTLAALVEWLDNIGLEKSVQQSESMNAIRILTIHKSKGLEFPIVIIPFFNWTLNHENNNNILWEKPPEELGWNVPVVPILYKKDLSKSYFAEHYLNERFAAAMDALNLMYVALTRPKNELYVFLQGSKEKNTKDEDIIKNVGNLLLHTIKNKVQEADSRDFFVSLSSNFSESDLLLELGEKEKYSNTKMKSDESFLQQDFSLKLPWEKISVKSLSVKNIDVVNEEKEKGIIIHELLSRIRYMDDFQQLIAEAKMCHIDKTWIEEELFRLKNEFETHPLIAAWFDKKADVITEQSIIASDGKEYRPDRIVRTANEIIVVDFKTGEQNPEYLKQVINYKNILQNVYNEPVKAYLVYVSPLQVIEVE
ncbi:MAG: UvrD-helicase domain-containing protein [Flavobacteriales bacterium]|nr:UvrD-helicase domain-containing protein [Flavobacteriales bacterium]